MDWHSDLPRNFVLALHTHNISHDNGLLEKMQESGHIVEGKRYGPRLRPHPDLRFGCRSPPLPPPLPLPLADAPNRPPPRRPRIHHLPPPKKTRPPLPPQTSPPPPPNP